MPHGYTDYSKQRPSPRPEDVGAELLNGQQRGGYGAAGPEMEEEPLEDAEPGEQDELQRAIHAMLMRRMAQSQGVALGGM